MSVTVSYGHLAHGLEFVSLAIPMTSSCSIYLYNGLNSRFRLLPILCWTCGGQFGSRLRQVIAPFSAPGLHQNLSGPWGFWAKWCQLPEKGSWCAGKGIGVWKTFWLCNCRMLAIHLLKQHGMTQVAKVWYSNAFCSLFWATFSACTLQSVQTS